MGLSCSRLAVASGRECVYEFDVTSRAGTYWYHPHPHNLICVIQDRQFDARSQLVFHSGVMMEVMNGFISATACS